MPNGTSSTLPPLCKHKPMIPADRLQEPPHAKSLACTSISVHQYLYRYCISFFAYCRSDHCGLPGIIATSSGFTDFPWLPVQTNLSMILHESKDDNKVNYIMVWSDEARQQFVERKERTPKSLLSWGSHWFPGAVVNISKALIADFVVPRHLRFIENIFHKRFVVSIFPTRVKKY